jgi:hypothetical protein
MSTGVAIVLNWTPPIVTFAGRLGSHGRSVSV